MTLAETIQQTGLSIACIARMTGYSLRTVTYWRTEGTCPQPIRERLERLAQSWVDDPMPTKANPCPVQEIPAAPDVIGYAVAWCIGTEAPEIGMLPSLSGSVKTTREIATRLNLESPPSVQYTVVSVSPT